LHRTPVVESRRARTDENAYRGTEARQEREMDDVLGRRGGRDRPRERELHMLVLGRCAAAVVAILVLVPATAGATAPQKGSSKLPSSACKLLTLAQVQEVLPGATDGKPIHDKADKEEICNWEVDLSSDYLGITVRPFTGDATTAKALFGTTDPDEKVKGLGTVASFASNMSDYTVHAVLGKLALVVKLEREDDSPADPASVAQLKSDATKVAKQAASKL
jgi:hypothetical protein